MTVVLPTIYYVYQHVDPDTGEIVYIGCGSKGRAWQYNKGSEHATRNGGRHSDHFRWLEDQTAKGFTMADVVVIVRKSLRKPIALKLERKLVAKHKPRFNRPMGVSTLCLSSRQLSWARENYGNTKYPSYFAVATHLGVSAMTIYRALNGQTKNYV